jgi:hypothetical protein
MMQVLTVTDPEMSTDVTWGHEWEMSKRLQIKQISYKRSNVKHIYKEL